MALTLDLKLSCPDVYVLEDGARFQTELGDSGVAFLSEWLGVGATQQWPSAAIHTAPWIEPR